MLTNLLILLPLLGALVIWVTPLPREATATLAVLIAVTELVVWIVVLAGFDFDSPVLQDAAQREWFGDLGVTYHVGFYGFSLWLAGLTVVVGVAAIGFGAWVGRERARAYFGLVLFLIGAVVGVFASQDLLLFYVFFEMMLIPIYILIGVWGGPKRASATITFVIYTMAGSLLMLASIVVFGLSQGTFSLIDSGVRAATTGCSSASSWRSPSRLRSCPSTVGCGRPTPKHHPRSPRSSPAWSPRPPSTGFSGSCCGTSRSQSTTGARWCSYSPRPASSTGRCSLSVSRTSVG